MMSDLRRRLYATTHRMRSYRARKSEYQVPRGYMLGWSTVALHHIMVILAGAVGVLIDPSPSVTAIVGGTVATWLWSLAFVLFGTTALLARLFNRARAEVVAVVTIAAGRVLWAGILIYSVARGLSDPGSLQVAFMLLAGAIFLVSWSLTVLVWLSGVPLGTPGSSSLIVALRDHLHEVVQQAEAEDDKAEE